ncbi:MAG: glycoside hydrolase family 3 protein, partial [Cyclonatronaceae bacterium]
MSFSILLAPKPLGYGLGGLVLIVLLLIAFFPKPAVKKASAGTGDFARTAEQLSYAPPGRNEQPDAYQQEVERQALELRKSMSLREKIAQLLVVRASGNYYASDDATFRRLSRQVEEHQVGGIIFFRGEVYNQAMLYNKLQEKAAIPLWISQDMEFGAAMRIGGSTRITPAMGIAATGNPQWAYEKGRITAVEARAMGVHQIYAPVVDVNNNPDNPVINRRSFSEDPETVSRFATAFIEGAQAEGVLATAKHFPGHGDTDLDSHTALPVINKTYEELLETELRPFQDVIEAGVHSVMSAHIAFP